MPPDDALRYGTSAADCQICALKPCCCPNTPIHKVRRSIHEGARDSARHRQDRPRSPPRREGEKVAMLFAYLKRIQKLDRLRMGGPSGAKDELLLVATAQNLQNGQTVIA